MPNAIIEESFLGPADLAHIFAATVLNIHPCVYDAFGMTIIEAASQGLPLLPRDPQDRHSMWGLPSPVTQVLESAGRVSRYDRLKNLRCGWCRSAFAGQCWGKCGGD